MGNDILRELRKAGLISDVKMSEELQSRSGRSKKESRLKVDPDQQRYWEAKEARRDQA